MMQKRRIEEATASESMHMSNSNEMDTSDEEGRNDPNATSGRRSDAGGKWTFEEVSCTLFFQ
jgi:hypothetical protein